MMAVLGLLAGCGGGPEGDWREAFGRPVGDPVAIRPAGLLEFPPTLDLPPPGGASRAGEALVVRAGAAP